jgi:hypothetical protein
MDKYQKYFTTITKFKSKKDIVEDINQEFDEEITDYNYKKIVTYFLKNKVIQEVSEKRKKFYISTSTLENKKTNIEDLFYAERLGISQNKNLTKINKVDYTSYLLEDAVIVNNELLKDILNPVG